MKRPCLYGTSFVALESIMATLLKFYHCGRFQFCTLQTVTKLADESRQLIEVDAIHRSVKMACFDENNVVAGYLGPRFSKWGPQTPGGPRRVARGSVKSLLLQHKHTGIYGKNVGPVVITPVGVTLNQ